MIGGASEKVLTTAEFVRPRCARWIIDTAASAVRGQIGVDQTGTDRADTDAVTPELGA